MNIEWNEVLCVYQFGEKYTYSIEELYQAFKERMMKELTVIESHIKHAPPDLVNREDL